MSGTGTLPATQSDQVLQECIDSKRFMVLTYETDRGWRTFKGKFTGGSSADHTLRVSLCLPDDGEDGALPKSGDILGCTFRVGHKKCMFSTKLDSSLTTEEDISATLRWPIAVQQLQRRAYDRVEPPRGTVVAVRFWNAIEKEHGTSEERDVRNGQLVDISAGGMRVKASDVSGLELDTTYRCVFTPVPGKPAFVIDAVLRHHEAAEGARAALGFQFVGLEATIEGRKALDRLAKLVSQFKRAHSRKRRSA